jgi:hypothetical protein
VHGVAEYGCTFATKLISLVLYVACHGDFEFNEVKEVRDFLYRINVLGEITVEVSGPFRGRFSFCFESIFESGVFETSKNKINFDSVFESVS